MLRQLLQIVLGLVLAQPLAGCDASQATSPVAPSSVPQAAGQPSTSVFGLSGFVLDTAFRPLDGARVEVLDGLHAGTSTIADATGQFSLQGTFDATTTFRATKDGYAAATRAWSCSVGSCPGPTGARPWLGFYLAVLASPVNIAGDYTLTLVADATCVALPTDLRSRTYAATVRPGSTSFSPTDTLFDVAVSGATFPFDSYQISIGVAGDYLGFGLYGGHNPFLVEEIAPSTYLAFSGWAPGVSVGRAVSPIATSFEGTIEYCESTSSMGRFYDCRPSQPIARCESQNHRLILTRR